MARLPRLEMAGAHYHVTSRGVERRTIFRDDSDCEKFVELLGWTATHFGWRVHAWVLMGNHYHLLIETTQGNLSRSMQRLNQRYSVAFNRRHRRVGTFFQGRFKAMLVEWDEAGLEVSRYVHLNPVRVKALGMSRSQQDERRHGPQAGERQKPEVVRARLEKLRSYPWSSLRAYAGFESTRHGWTKVPLWRRFALREREARRSMNGKQARRTSVGWRKRSAKTGKRVHGRSSGRAWYWAPKRSWRKSTSV